MSRGGAATQGALGGRRQSGGGGGRGGGGGGGSGGGDGDSGDGNGDNDNGGGTVANGEVTWESNLWWETDKLSHEESSHVGDSTMPGRRLHGTPTPMCVPPIIYNPPA